VYRPEESIMLHLLRWDARDGLRPFRRFEAGGNISVLNLARLMTYLGHPMDAAGVVPEFQAMTMKEFVQPSRRRAR
jgi:hypothetical protein